MGLNVWPGPDIGVEGEEVFRQALVKLRDIPFVVGFGTALGIHRDGALIPTDTDIDICIRRGQINPVREAFQDWPLVLVRPRHGPNQHLYHPQKVIVDVSVWKPHDAGIEWNQHSFPRSMFDAEWVETKYGSVPLPGDIETYLETLYGDWRTPRHRVKP